MSGRVEWTGLDELRADLRRLPADLAAEGSAIVNGAAEVARAEVVAQYEAHVVTGNLASHVSIGRGAAVGAFSASVILKSTAPHAHLFEFGSEARHYVTIRGKKKLLGQMPAANIFVPIVIRRRRKMEDALAAMVERHGLTVTR